MFVAPKIFSHIPHLISYVGDKTLPMRPKQFHNEFPEYKKGVEILQESFGLEKAFFMAQHQSSELLEITYDNLGEIHYIDACYTRLSNITLNVVIADCVPVLFYDSTQKISGVVHAGWRGTTKNILTKTLSSLRENYNSNPEDILLYFGPSISQKYYEVGEDIASQFSSESIVLRDGCYYLDLRNENLKEAQEFGISQYNIEVSQECTYELSEKYFSYRREGLRKNFVCGIGLK